MSEIIGRQSQSPWLGHNGSSLESVEVAQLRYKPLDASRRSKADVRRAKPFVARHPDRALPIVVGKNNEVLCGAIFVEAAREEGISRLRVVRQSDLSEEEELLYSTASNKLLSIVAWDGEAMELAVRNLEDHFDDFGAELIGFAPGELDHIIGLASSGSGEDNVADPTAHCVSKLGSIYRLDNHLVVCGDATLAATFSSFSGTELATAAICDPPFGCRIDGFVSKRGKHKDFVQAAGEMSEEELRTFFQNFCKALRPTLAPGALVYLFIDWRSLSLLLAVGEEVFGKLINFCVWAKDRAGMGSFYRSQHELVLVFAVLGAKHRNNIELGRHGRDRSNLWSYPSAASSRNGRERDMLKHHPTPKTVEMIADAMLDCSSRGEIIIDAFLGSGSSLIAAERTSRICRGVELDPHYVDLTIRRWQDWTGKEAVDVATGRTFNELEREVLAGGAS